MLLGGGLYGLGVVRIFGGVARNRGLGRRDLLTRRGSALV